MTIVIATPTGNIGHHIMRELLGAGEQIRVIVRNPEKLDAATRERVEVIQGSINDAALLTQAFNNVEAVFWCVPQSNTQEKVLDYYLDFANAAATAIRKAEVPRIVAISSGGKGLAQHAGPISALHAMEDVLDATGATTRHLRCGSFMENFLWQIEAIAYRGAFFYPFPDDFPIPMVATRDIAAIAVEWLKHRDWSGQEGVAVHGPEDLSLNQISEIFSEVFSKPVRFQRVSTEAYRESLLQNGFSPAFAQGLLDMYAAAANGLYRAEARTPETTTPTTLKQWAEAVMLPALNHIMSA